MTCTTRYVNGSRTRSKSMRQQARRTHNNCAESTVWKRDWSSHKPIAARNNLAAVIRDRQALMSGSSKARGSFPKSYHHSSLRLTLHQDTPHTSHKMLSLRNIARTAPRAARFTKAVRPQSSLFRQTAAFQPAWSQAAPRLTASLHMSAIRRQEGNGTHAFGSVLTRLLTCCSQ